MELSLTLNRLMFREVKTLDFDYLRTLSAGHDKNAILSELIQHFGQDVWNFAFSLTQQRSLADDITQDAFLKAFRNLETFKGQSHIKTWLLSITRNVAADYRRSAFFRKVTLTERFSNPGISPSAEYEALDRLASNEVWKQVLRLPVKYREVLVLYAHNGLQMKEIAQLLDISEGTVKSRLFRARVKISDMLKRGEQK
jgi:RNA polymerase sigma-70 factor, ECF subfamily